MVIRETTFILATTEPQSSDSQRTRFAENCAEVKGKSAVRCHELPSSKGSVTRFCPDSVPSGTVG